MGLVAVKFQYRKRYGLHATHQSRPLIGNPNSFNTASGMDCMQPHFAAWTDHYVSFQYRKRYGLHATPLCLCHDYQMCLVSIPQAVWIACNNRMESPKQKVTTCFNTASGMDCMQHRPSQPLGQLNPEAGFLNGSLFLANRRNLAGFFCRQNRLKTSANPVISRKLLSTGKI